MGATYAVITAQQAKQKLVSGNKKYINSSAPSGDVSREIRAKTLQCGQHPYAVVITCSDFRVIPEAIFSAGIGELFVIRNAGNVIDNTVLGSVQYAAEHLGCRLILVLGHTNCGAVGAAMQGQQHGYVRFITEEIAKVIGQEADYNAAVKKNVVHSVEVIKNALSQNVDSGLCVAGGIYRLEDGMVEFLDI